VRLDRIPAYLRKHPQVTYATLNSIISENSKPEVENILGGKVRISGGLLFPYQLKAKSRQVYLEEDARRKTLSTASQKKIITLSNP
jgi:hypothetical protein